MQANFFHHKDFGHPTPAGVVTLAHGVAQIPPELDFLSTTQIFQPDTLRVLLPADGEAYIKALPYTFNGSYFWAELEV